MKKAQEAYRLKRAQREIVRRKVEEGLPISEQERAYLQWKGGGPQKNQNEKSIIAAAAKLMIRPQSVTELRMLVETTAAKHSYNPIESLILQTRSVDIAEKDKAAIHRALLPFLCPQLPAPRPQDEKSGSGHGIKVVVTQFTFPDRRGSEPDQALHLERPATVDTTAQEVVDE